jgi:hypothetical protein
MRYLLPVIALTLAACGADPEPEAPPRPPLPTATVAAGDLDRILLTPTEAGKVIAKVGLVEQPFSDVEAADGMHDDPAGCAQAVYPIMAAAYDPPVAVHGVTMRDAKNIPRLTEAVVSYDTPADAQRQIDRLTDVLKRCAATTVTVVTSGFDNVWHTRDVGSVEQGATLASGLDDHDWLCHRAIAARANVVLDVQACAGDGPDPTPHLIDAMTEKMR